ncbi:putative receptor protein kinase ZmPK1 [Rutidosis leptorrhynchoides]|uniref:putative receptor protein kinase ZmPK1 n=1 Tax=Rutidosis leptorrhynchoides TaxID=125765 RepID=UPI003A99A897
MTEPFHLHNHNHKIIFFHLIFMFYFLFPIYTLSPGQSLSVENNYDIIRSPNKRFTAGFHQVGLNAYCFAIWFSNDQPTTENRTIVWMANRDEPVNGKSSKLSLLKDGNLVLTDADQYIIWSTQTKSKSTCNLKLHNNGNLVLHEQNQILWQSFDYPTDTLLPNQKLTKDTQLVSSRSLTNFSSGFYKLFFDSDSILRLHYDGPEVITNFWPDPALRPWEVGRYQYLYSRKASLDSYGRFNSSDGLSFLSNDFGIGPQRMMKIDIDGNLRVYSLVEYQKSNKWEVQWQAVSHSCRVHGICGQNSLCTYSQNLGRSCTCLHGYKMVNSKDWSYGCEPVLKTCKPENQDFIELRHVEYYSFDIRYHENYTLDACKEDCLHDCSCKGFQFGYKNDVGTYYCYIKTSLYNGYQMGFYNSMYIKLPKTFVSSFNQTFFKQTRLGCAAQPVVTPLARSYEKKHENKLLRYVLVLGCVIGFLEIVFILFFWYKNSRRLITPDQGYFPVVAFRKFKYHELKKASRNFKDEIGRGGASVVYKGTLSDNRIAAIKKLKNLTQRGEGEFQDEISTIGRLNHMNLIETWGYCVEGKHRLIVYEHMENGSLAENLVRGTLDWEKRIEIAKGTAKGLAYLHEECLEWVLHCDVKPHNILLGANYTPKVADFGLSKLVDRAGVYNSRFSTVRGTRGYMAPEWVFNLPITSKVDVFSYGVVVLEMITGRGPGGKNKTSDGNGQIEPGVIEWVRDKVQEFGQSQTGSWVEEIVDGSVQGEFDWTIMENLVRIALQCVEEDMQVRPTMSQVVNMLLHPKNDTSLFSM